MSNNNVGDTTINPRITQIEQMHNKRQQGAKRKSGDVSNNETLQSNNKKGKGGRKAGGRNWTAEEIKILFEAMEEILPCGREMWEATAAKCAEISVEEWTRNGESCKKKFEKMALMKVPTGTTEVPPDVKKAKEILEEIEKEERMGVIAANELSDFEELGEEEKCATALKGAKLFDEEKNVARRPSTRRSLVRDVTASFDVLAASQIESTKLLCGSMDLLTNEIKAKRGNQTIDELNNLEGRIERIEENMVSMEENMVSMEENMVMMTSSLDDMNQKMNQILNVILQKK
jgi:hypothetical protein